MAILQDDPAVTDGSVQYGWSLDKINGVLLFLGCIKGYEASSYAPLFIEWVQQRQSIQANQNHSIIADSSQSAVAYAASCMYSRTSRDQLKSEGLLTQKKRKQLHRQWIYKRGSLNPADMMSMKHMAAQLTAHEEATFKLQKSSTAGVGVQTAYNMVQASIQCKPPVAVCLYPKTRKYYAVCVALQLSPSTRRTVLKIEDRSIVNFLRTEAQDWRGKEMGRSQFLNPDLTAKLKLMSMLLATMRFAEVVFVQVGNTDPWAIKANAAANKACKFECNDQWLSEHHIDWSVLASVLQTFQPINKGQASEQQWKLGAKLDVYSITNEQWAVIATKVKPHIHVLGVKLLPLIQQAATLTKDQYAATTNKLYAEFMEAINLIVGAITGWRLPVKKQAARHTKAFKAVKQHIWDMKQAVKVCYTNKFYACKQDLVKQAVDAIEDTIGPTKCTPRNVVNADPISQMSSVCLRGEDWISQQEQFVNRFETADSQVAAYQTIRWADANGNYRLVKSLTFQQSDNTCTIPLSDMAKYYGDIGKERPGTVIPTDEEVMDFLGCSPVNTHGEQYRNARKVFAEPYTRTEYLGALKHKAVINPGILGVPTVVFYMLAAEPTEGIVDIVDIDLAFANAFWEHNKLYDPLRLFLCMLLQKANKPSYTEKSAWRNILMGTPLRKTLSTVEGAMHAQYMQHMNALGYNVVSR